MLKRLVLEQIAIIDRVVLDLSPGLTVITGETGSGKSILLDAIALAFGAKVSPKDVIRQGQERGQVELLLSLDQTILENSVFSDQLISAGIDWFPDETELLISREFTHKGSRCRINGIPVARELVEQLRPLLLDLHGQHELTNLFQMESQRVYLDVLGDQKFQALKQEVSETYQQYRRVQQQIEAIQNQQRQWLQQRDFLTYQCQELADANLNDSEEDQYLQAQRQRLAFAEQIKQNTDEAIYYLSSEAPLLEGCHQLQKLLGIIAPHDPALQSFLDSALDIQESVRQLGQQLSRYVTSIESDPAQLNEVISRLDVLERLKRKYGPTLVEVFQTFERLKQELQQLNGIEADLETLDATEEHLAQQLKQYSDQLTIARQQIARHLEKELQAQLVRLSLPAAQFEVLFEKQDYSVQGQDDVTFLFSANPGEPPRSLAKVASGGELSRVLLALKVLIAAKIGIATLIFDEIDTGISGATAKVMAEKLLNLSTQVQVIAITHQPVIAALADHHWHVEKRQILKNAKATAVAVEVKQLEDEPERLSTLGQMIGGTAAAVDVAAQLRSGKTLA